MPLRSQSLCLISLAFLFIEVNLSLFNNKKKIDALRETQKLPELYSHYELRVPSFPLPTVKSQKLLWNRGSSPASCKTAASGTSTGLHDSFLLWSQLKSSDWEGFSYSAFLSSHKCCSLQHAILKGTIWRISLNYYGPFIMLGFNCWVWKPDKDQILNGVLRTETDTATLFIALILYPSYILML